MRARALLHASARGLTGLRLPARQRRAAPSRAQQGRFATMSDQIIGRIDEMGNRIDELESAIGELMAHV